MRTVNVSLLIQRSLLNERLRQAQEREIALQADLNVLIQLLVNDGCLVYPEHDIVKEYDQSEEMFAFLNNVCQNSQHKLAKDLIIQLGMLGFDNLHYRLVCEWHQAFSASEFFKFQDEARNLMTLIR